jgi:transcriptional regulator with XRE-family HTH domain
MSTIAEDDVGLQRHLREMLLFAMEKENISRTEMARKMHVTRGYATKVINSGSPSVLYRWLRALNYDVEFELVEEK